MRTRSFTFAALALLPSLLSAAWAQPAFLVKDLGNTLASGAPVGSSPGIAAGSVEVDGVLYFPASDGIHGVELWRSDGTTAGTRMVRDVCPGACSSFLAVQTSLTPFQHKVYWYASDGAHELLMASDGTPQGTAPFPDPASPAAGHVLMPMGEAGGRLLLSGGTRGGGELWATDGTAAGTLRLRIFRTGTTFSSPVLVGQLGGVLVFKVGDQTQGQTLWATDGTKAGTVPLIVGTPGVGFLDAVAAGGRLFIEAFGPAGNAGWVSDGTPAGTQPLAGVSFDSKLTAVGSQVFFARSTATGWELWTSDGTLAGTALVKAFTDSFPNTLTAVGNRLFFDFQTDLWTSDGTAAGTLAVRRFVSTVGGFTTFGDRLAFFADDGTHGSQPWISDGTPAGTYLVAEILPLHPFIIPDWGIVGVLDGRWLFAAPGSQGWFLWSSDGTPGNLIRVHRLDAQTSSSPQPLADLDGTLIFAAVDATDRWPLWRTDGTAAGTAQITQDSDSQPPGLVPTVLGRIGGRLFFASVATGTSTGLNPYSLWASDGTAAGTRPVPDALPLELNALTAAQIGGSLYVQGSSPQQSGLFKTDGTDAGTVFLHRFDPNTERLSQLLAVGDRLFFVVGDAILWTSDGTVAGTKPVLPDHLFDGPAFEAVLGSRLVFAVLNGTERELWVSDGTAAGTYRVAGLGPVSPGSGASSPGGPVIPGPQTVVNGRLLFVGYDSDHGAELWSTNGTAAGTRLVADIAPGATGSAIGPLTVAGRRIFFTADDGVHGNQLWATDGTAAGTHRITDIIPGAAGSAIGALTVVDKRVFFAAGDGVHGRELWVSDGTAGGTRMVADVNPGAGSSLPAGLTAVDGRLLFSADDGVHGVEPWVSDGTAKGTRMVQDIAPGPLPSSPGRFLVSGGFVYFSATDAAHGFELWAVPRSALGAHP
jgi:ELWxxDGT repeat protein